MKSSTALEFGVATDISPMFNHSHLALAKIAMLTHNANKILTKFTNTSSKIVSRSKRFPRLYDEVNGVPEGFGP